MQSEHPSPLIESRKLLTADKSCPQDQAGMDGVTNYAIKAKLQGYVPALTYHHTSSEKVL